MQRTLDGFSVGFADLNWTFATEHVCSTGKFCDETASDCAFSQKQIEHMRHGGVGEFSRWTVSSLRRWQHDVRERRDAGASVIQHKGKARTEHSSSDLAAAH